MIIPMLCVTIFVILVVWFLLPRVARLMIHTPTAISRSEERRVGKECRSRWWPDHQQKEMKENSGPSGAGERTCGTREGGKTRAARRVRGRGASRCPYAG